MRQFKIIAIAFSLVLVNTGCSMMAPKYTTSIENVQALTNNGSSEVKVGQISTGSVASQSNPIKIRTNSLQSPYDNSFSAFVAEAIKQELTLAKRNSFTSNIEITGELLKNDIDATGFNTGMTTIEARFKVLREGKTNFDQIKSVNHEFPSHFVGAIAIPNAVLSYNVALQKLLNSLYEDKAFIEAIK